MLGVALLIRVEHTVRRRGSRCGSVGCRWYAQGPLVDAGTGSSGTNVVTVGIVGALDRCVCDANDDRRSGCSDATPKTARSLLGLRSDQRLPFPADPPIARTGRCMGERSARD